MAGQESACGNLERNASAIPAQKTEGVPSKPMAVVRAVWWWLRQVFGDAAYENYLRHASKPSCPDRKGRTCHSQGTVSEKEFYLDRLRRKHNTVNRCC